MLIMEFNQKNIYSMYTKSAYLDKMKEQMFIDKNHFKFYFLAQFKSRNY